MSRQAKAVDGTKLDKLSFEDALEKLETTVDTMESGDLPLESLLARYEEGMKLAKACQSKLADAETKIQLLEKGAQGALKLKPFATEAVED